MDTTTDSTVSFPWVMGVIFAVGLTLYQVFIYDGPKHFSLGQLTLFFGVGWVFGWILKAIVRIIFGA